MNHQIFLGDSLEILKTLAPMSVDSLVTDPPAGIGLLGLEWDKDKGGRDAWMNWLTGIMTECHRVLKPGAYGFVWAIPRTSHWTAMALEDAGFQVKDVVTHVFGSGFPKSLAIDKALDRAKYTDTDLLYKVTSWIRNRRDELGLTNKQIDEISGVNGGACHWTALPPNGEPHIPTKERWERLTAVLGPAPAWIEEIIRPAHEVGNNWAKREIVGFYQKASGGLGGEAFKSTHRTMTEPSNEESKKWQGWGTALKPASEHWILIQKPISEHNIAANIRKHGTGGINIDASRIPVNGKIPSTSNLNFKESGYIWNNSKRSRDSIYTQHPKGRFPANFVVTKSDGLDCAAAELNRQAGGEREVSGYFKNFKLNAPFYYCKKPTRSEKGVDNPHPTVKPLNLMRYLCRMVTPPGGTVMDLFMGSGTTGVAALLEEFKFVGIEQDSEYFSTAQKRITGVNNHG